MANKDNSIFKRLTPEKVKMGVDNAIRKHLNKPEVKNFLLNEKNNILNIFNKILNKMNLSNLTREIKIERKLDADNIDIKDILDTEIVIEDYEIRQSSSKEDNWIKVLIGIPEIKNNRETGELLAYEFHGNYQYLIKFLRMAEEKYNRGFLPLENVVIQNKCGYVFKGSTKQMKYLD